MPAICEARHRRSPAISSYPPADLGWTMIGCSTPRSRIESASPASDVVVELLARLGGVRMDVVAAGCRAGGRSRSRRARRVPCGTHRPATGSSIRERSSGRRAHRALTAVELLGQLVVGDPRRAVGSADRERNADRQPRGRTAPIGPGSCPTGARPVGDQRVLDRRGC